MRFLHCQLLLPRYFFHLGIHSCTSGAAWGCTPPCLLISPSRLGSGTADPVLPDGFPGKLVFTGNSNLALHKTRRSGEPTPLLDWIGVSADVEEEEEGQEEGGRGFTDDYPTIHQPHTRSISSSPVFLSCTYSETLDNCMPAWGLRQGFGLSRCPVFSTQTQNATRFFIYIFLWEGEKGVHKKNLWRNLLFKPFNNGARGRTLWLSFPLSANPTSQS